MELTKQYLREKFSEYNKLYFYGKLGKCDFHFFSKNNGNYGWYNYKQDNNGSIKSEIWVGTCVNWTEETLKELLIHEMIHMYNRTIDNRKIVGILGHGRLFRKQCRRIKKEFGIEIKKHPDYEYINKKFSPKIWERILLFIIDW